MNSLWFCALKKAITFDDFLFVLFAAGTFIKEQQNLSNRTYHLFHQFYFAVDAHFFT